MSVSGPLCYLVTESLSTVSLVGEFGATYVQCSWSEVDRRGIHFTVRCTVDGEVESFSGLNVSLKCKYLSSLGIKALLKDNSNKTLNCVISSNGFWWLKSLKNVLQSVLCRSICFFTVLAVEKGN